jgi:23S rRNA U2552 (ribose-2'-O)-methylase RlmE/FtsJ
MVTDTMEVAGSDLQGIALHTGIIILIMEDIMEEVIMEDITEDATTTGMDITADVVEAGIIMDQL